MSALVLQEIHETDFFPTCGQKMKLMAYPELRKRLYPGDRKQAIKLRRIIIISSMVISLIFPIIASAATPEERRGGVRDRIQSTAGNEEFVRGLYQQLLNREPDPEGLKAWIEQISNGSLTRMAVRREFMKSPEYKEIMANKYRKPVILPGTDSTKPGTIIQTPSGPVNIPVQTKPGAEKPEKEPLSPEKENEAYVNWLYRKVLQREADEGGLKANLEALNNGSVTRNRLLQLFMESDEYQKKIADGRITPFDPATAGDFKNSLDDLITGWTQTEGGATGGQHEPKRFELVEKDTGAVEFETSGITHQDQDNVKGGDFWFFVMEGDFGQVRLQHTAGQTEDGTKRAIRYIIKMRPKFGETRMKIEVASDNLPDWHKWRVEWEPGMVSFFLDDHCIGKETGLNIKPKHVMIGGYVGGTGRNFKGNWRGFKAR